jgi:hypothetical protein
MAACLRTCAEAHCQKGPWWFSHAGRVSHPWLEEEEKKQASIDLRFPHLMLAAGWMAPWPLFHHPPARDWPAPPR